MDWDAFDQLVAEKYINVRKHPTKELFIANYAPMAAYDRKWTPETEACRGLIYDANRDIVARPFRKFFNYGEVRPPAFVLTKTPHVSTKMDGSLGIYYRYDGVEGIATRGSFESDQAKWATAYWVANHGNIVVPDGITPMFEIIYPSNRIVVDYRGREMLILLAVIDTKTGTDIPLWEATWWDGPVVETHYGLDNVDDAYTFGTGRDDEGVVCCWYTPGEPSYRLKIKAPEYVRLHRIVTNVSTKTIWNHLLENRSFEELLDNVPDEFNDWVRKTIEELTADYQSKYEAIQFEFYKAVQYAPENHVSATAPWDEFAEWCVSHRPVFARYVTHNCKNKAAMFLWLDGRQDKLKKAIWESVKPAYELPFKQYEEE